MLAFIASDWFLSRCVWSLHVWRFAQDHGHFGTFWLPPRRQEHGNIIRFVARYAVVLSSAAVGATVWASFNQAALSAGQRKPIKKTVLALAFFVPLIAAVVVAVTASTL